MKYILAGLTVLFSVTGYCQNKQYVYYFDKDLTLVPQSKSVFKGIGIYKDGTLEFELYHVPTNILLTREHYTDSSLTIQHGLFQTFYFNDALASEGSYVKGVKDGLWVAWDSANRRTDSTIYSNGDKILEVHTGYHRNGKLDSLVINDVKADRLNLTYYDDKGQLTYEVNFIGQKGITKSYDSAMHVTIDTVTDRLEIEASFPGGERAWTAYVSSHLQHYFGELFEAGVSGTCRVKFIVRKDGTISNVEPITMRGTKLADVAVKIISKGPKWKPAYQYGRYVNAFREQPISFTVDK
jgi:antitoxin component YwqK of YwqJK toxin-antitoxin module